MRCVLLLLACCFLAGTTSGAEEKPAVFSVLDFGAVPDDGRDDGPAVRAAIAAARGSARPVILFPPGVYRFRSAEHGSLAFVNVADFPEITVRGEGAELVGMSLKSMLYFERCGKVRVSGITVDWEPLPFTAGRIVAASAEAIEIEVHPGHPVRGGIRVENVTAYDAATRLPVREFHPDHFRLTQKAFKEHAEVIGPQRLRIPLSAKPESLAAGRNARPVPPVGSHVVAWYQTRGGNGFRFIGCGEVVAEDNRVFAAPGMGFAMHSCERVTLRRCRVEPRPGSGRWLSTTVDATHCNMIRQRVEYLDCHFEAMGDDAINVHGTWKRVEERDGPRALVAGGWGGGEGVSGPGKYALQSGDMLEFGTAENPLVAAFTARIVESVPVERGGVELTRLLLDRDLPDFIQPGSAFASTAEAPELLVRGTTFRGGRGRGIQLQTRNALVEDCLFEALHSSGVSVSCGDLERDFESIGTRDVTIRNNVFRLTAAAVSSGAGRHADVHENLVITGNRIEQAPRTALRLGAVKSGLVRGNVIECAAAEAITVTRSSGLRVEENEVTRWEP